jgi:hypothetical protein
MFEVAAEFKAYFKKCEEFGFFFLDYIFIKFIYLLLKNRGGVKHFTSTIVIKGD